MKVDRAIWPPALVLAIAAAVRLAFPFDGLYGQDAFAYFNFARALWPHWRHGAPLPPLFWPHGYPLAVAALLPLVHGPRAAQLVSALGCATCAATTFLLVAELQRWRGEFADATPRVIAGLCAGASGIVLRSSQVAMADGLALGLTGTALWCAVRAIRTRRGAWLVPCALAAAWGAITRWQIGLIALPIAAAVWWAGPRQPLWWALAAAAALAILIPELLVIRHVPMALVHHEWFTGWSAPNGLRREFHTAEGHARYHFPVALFYVLRLAWPDALFPTVLALSLVGASAMLRQKRGPEAALLLGWPLVTWAFISGIPYENPRFIWPTLPAVAALAGFGYQRLGGRLGQRGRAALATGLAASLTLGLAFAAREHHRTVSRKNAERAALAWIDAAVPRDATLWQSGGTLLAEEYGATRMLDVYLYRALDIPELLAHHCPCFFLRNAGDGSDRWTGLPSELFFEQLRRDPGLTLVATHPPFTLFRVNSGPREPRSSDQ